MLSLDLSIMASNHSAAHTAMPIFSCNNHVMELVVNRNYEEEWHCLENSQVLYLVLEGSLTFRYTNDHSFEVKKGEYVIADAGRPFKIQDVSGCNYLLIHKQSFNRINCSAVENDSPVTHGNFLNDLMFKPIEINNHHIQLINTNDMVTSEAFLDSDRAIFILQGEMVMADVYGEEILSEQDIANIPAHTFHRLYCKAQTKGFTFQQKDARVMYLNQE